jgi:NhaP-type Na+/H+ or K+/H+ antiporter
VVYGLLVLQAGIPNGEKLFDLIAVTIALSIIVHSSTDVPVAHRLRIEPPDHLPSGIDQDHDYASPPPRRDAEL